MNLRKVTFKQVEAELYSYRETKKLINNLRQQIIYGKKEEDENDMSGKNSVQTIGRPTEQIATALVQDKQLRNAEEIVSAIDEVYEKASDDHKRLIRKKYWSNQHLNWTDISIQLSMHRNTAMKMRREIVYAIAKRTGKW